MPMNRNVQSNRMCEDWTVIFLQSVLDGWWGFLWFFPATMLNRMIQTEYRAGEVYAAIVHSVIL